MKNYIKDKRILANKTQEEVAREINISLSQYKNIESGRTENPGVYIAIKIKRALNVNDIEELFPINE